MNLELYFAPGACSFVPHVALEAVRAATGQAFEPKLVKLHKGEQRTPEYLAMNPNGQVPVLVADGKPLTQIVAICEFLDRAFPQAGLLPTESWSRAQALAQLAWMNNTVHPTFSRVFRAADYAESEAAQAEIRNVAQVRYRKLLERIQGLVAGAKPYWFGERIGHADIAVACVLRFAGEAHPALFPAARYPELAAHCARCEALPVFAEIMQPLAPPSGD